MVTSLASLELLKRYRPDAIENCIGTAGFSLGEITSLVFAAALPFDQGKSIKIQSMKKKNQSTLKLFDFQPFVWLMFEQRKCKRQVISTKVEWQQFYTEVIRVHSSRWHVKRHGNGVLMLALKIPIVSLPTIYFRNAK